MTWPELVRWAERNGMIVGTDPPCEDGEGGYWADLISTTRPEFDLEVVASSLPAAKRALCRVVERIRQAK